MKIKFYRNKRNENKYLEVHSDGHYHNTVRQFMYWKNRKWGVVISVVKNFTGDGHLHRWGVRSLREVLEDYEEVKDERLHNVFCGTVK